MAKRKRSTALFEVISKSRHYSRPKPALADGWVGQLARFFGRPRFQPIVPSHALQPVFARSAAAQEAAFEEEHEPEPTGEERAAVREAADAAVAVAVEDDAPDHMSHGFEAPPSAQNLDIQPPTADAAAQSEAAAPHADLADHTPATNMHVSVDPERRQIALRMSYTTAVIGGFALMVVVGLGILIGQRLTHGGQPLLAQSTTDELRKGPKHPEVLDPPTRRSQTNANGGAARANTSAQVARPAPSSSKLLPETSAPPATTVGNAQGHPGVEPPTPDKSRYLGMNYAIVQSYPTSEAKMATEAAAFLNKKGVPCTVEQNVKGYLPVCVVGLDGFQKQSSPEYKAYVARIQQLSAEYTANNRSYKAFTPVAKKWDKQD